MHPYTEKPGDIITKQYHSNGALYLYTVLKDGKPANGWSRKSYFQNDGLQEEENYSNSLLIEKISYDERGFITAHKMWNNRLKQLVDKPAHPKLPKPNVVAGYSYFFDCVQQLPAISEFIRAEYDKNLLSQSYDAFRKSGQGEAKWTMTGKQMRFTIYFEEWEGMFQWGCQCDTEDLYWKARAFLKTRF